MLQVIITAVEGSIDNPRTVIKGRFFLKDGNLFAQPSTKDNAPLFRSLLFQPIAVVKEGFDELVEIDPKTEPEEWLKNLYLELKSYTLMASKAEDVEEIET
jgi:hypothetical protein